jgi:hypothetical protein
MKIAFQPVKAVGKLPDAITRNDGTDDEPDWNRENQADNQDHEHFHMGILSTGGRPGCANVRQMN